eukprot:scaffold1658_cov115-Isochrysis_galbana.AAC.1
MLLQHFIRARTHWRQKPEEALRCSRSGAGSGPVSALRPRPCAARPAFARRGDCLRYAFGPLVLERLLPRKQLLEPDELQQPAVSFPLGQDVTV